MREAQQRAHKAGIPMTDYECYGTFHGGCGLMVVCDHGDVQQVMHEARADGHDPHVIGMITESDQKEIVIRSRFSQEGSFLSSLYSS